MKYSLIYNGTLIDGNGGKTLPEAVILIKNNMIVAVGTEDSISLPDEQIKKIDANGMFILPGFIDTHVHIMANGFKMEDTIHNPLSLYFYKAVENMHKTIDAGVTTVRDAGLADVGVKIAVEKEIITGPRIQISVMPLSISGGHFDFWLNSGFDIKVSYPGLPESLCDGEEEVRKRVREILRSGAEFIKVMVTGGVMSANDGPEHTQFTVEELKVMVQEGKYHDNVKVMAHGHGLEGIKNALKAGVHSIEHGTYLDNEAINMMIDQDTYLVPTCLVIKQNKKFAESGDLPEYSRAQALEIVDIHDKNIKNAYKAGVKIVMGTDCGVIPHGLNLRELGFLCDIGMSPQEAIMAGTKYAAECMGWQDKIGTVEPGKLADIIISKKDPILDIKSLGNPDNVLLVMKDGKIVKNLLN
ncbi:MAG: amidohydrolase family protein [Methanobacterium sp.]|uniref:metal-dependent hydrolase family protein n=1 Tax=Methanobacterium sp. TaxID=2164 RepID=UPI003D6478C0|nr:amidohydrolase family protein [Methanobacterium sp.]